MLKRVLSKSLGRGFLSILCAFILGLAGCEDLAEKPVDQPPVAAGVRLEEISLKKLDGFTSDRLAEALPALLRSCARYMTQPDDRLLGPAGLAGTVADWRQACSALKAVEQADDGRLGDLLARYFVPFRVLGPNGPEGLFTGYYEAELTGSLVPQSSLSTPFYGLPEDLVGVDLGAFRADWKGTRLQGRVVDGKLLPYHERAAIDEGVLGNVAPVLAWADDPVEAFIMQIQGSGRVRLPDGRVLRLGFAGSNGHGFTAIGRLMLQRGLISPDEANMASIRSWLKANREAGVALMRENARYIFFREIEGEGPIGSQGVALTPGRSLAIDPKHLPLGAPFFLETTWPGGKRPLNRLVVAQDTGAAIKGEIRGDLFWGAGEEAFLQAGGMKQAGRLTLFLPRAVADRRRAGS